MKKLLMWFLFCLSMSVMAEPVDVNSADAATLAKALHGIGLKKAQAIVADREKNGAFKTLEDLGRVKGIGDKTLAKNKADIQFGAGVAAPAATPAAAAPAASAPAPVAAPAAPAPAPAAPASSAAPFGAPAATPAAAAPSLKR